MWSRISDHIISYILSFLTSVSQIFEGKMFEIACRQEIFLIWNTGPARDFVQLIRSPTSNLVIIENALIFITSHLFVSHESIPA